MVSVLTPKRLASTPVGSDERAISWRTTGVVRACGWMDSIRSSCGEELGVAGRQSAKRTPQSRNAPDPNNVPLPNKKHYFGRFEEPFEGARLLWLRDLGRR
jgi:hypothetical protein